MVQGWMFGVSYQGRFQVSVSGIRPLTSSFQRSSQFPKLGKETTARLPMRSICASTSRGFSTAWKVRDSTT